jgi:hypothetical protein
MSDPATVAIVLAVWGLDEPLEAVADCYYYLAVILLGSNQQ